MNRLRVPGEAYELSSYFPFAKRRRRTNITTACETNIAQTASAVYDKGLMTDPRDFTQEGNAAFGNKDKNAKHRVRHV